MFDMRDQGESYFHIRDRQHFVLMNVHGYTCENLPISSNERNCLIPRVVTGKSEAITSHT